MEADIPRRGYVRNKSKLALALVGTGALLAASVAAVAAIPGYKGLEGKAVASYPKPAIKSGFKCTIGFQNPLAANESLQYMQKGAIAQAKALKCKLIVLDDALSVDKQVSNMQ